MGKGTLGPDGYEVSDNNEAQVGAVGEQNAAYRKLQAENNALKADLSEATATIEELKKEVATNQLPLSDERETAILAVLEGLDHKNKEHWTEAGLPRIEVICATMNDDTVTRSEVEAALPGYIRQGG